MMDLEEEKKEASFENTLQVDVVGGNACDFWRRRHTAAWTLVSLILDLSEWLTKKLPPACCLSKEFSCLSEKPSWNRIYIGMEA